jgi:hypothetical protein
VTAWDERSETTEDGDLAKDSFVGGFPMAPAAPANGQEAGSLSRDCSTSTRTVACRGCPGAP